MRRLPQRTVKGLQPEPVPVFFSGHFFGASAGGSRKTLLCVRGVFESGGMYGSGFLLLRRRRECCKEEYSGPVLASDGRSPAAAETGKDIRDLFLLWTGEARQLLEPERHPNGQKRQQNVEKRFRFETGYRRCSRLLGCTVLVSFCSAAGGRRQWRGCCPAAEAVIGRREKQMKLILALQRQREQLPRGTSRSLSGAFSLRTCFNSSLLWIRRVRRNGGLPGVTGDAVSAGFVAALEVIHSPSVLLPGIHFIHKNSLLRGSTLVPRESAG